MNNRGDGAGFGRLFVGFIDIGEPAPTGFGDVFCELSPSINQNVRSLKFVLISLTVAIFAIAPPPHHSLIHPV
ncbi:MULTISPECIES: hypothetical protein [unclassified Microcoleus]|uniref:hypothetical protein n=1 Tax=unclassified Microcoleus TaxID=2642155 RepID=UPI002FD29122